MNNTQFFKKPVFLFSLLLTAVGLYAISLPEILFGWDERFHALVALNLTHDIFPPTLYPEKVVDHYDYDPWYRTHIWLHKPPLFTYQIALFFKLFGSSLFVLRLHSLVMWLVMYFALYGGARNSGLKEHSSAWLSAIFCLSPMLLSLMNGSLGMDHNDITFVSYISVSFYFLAKYFKKPNPKIAAAIGLFAGLAVLTKWLAGSLVFLPFALMLPQIGKKKKLLHFILALAICILVVAPWHLLVYVRFPHLYLAEMKYNSRHFGEVLEGHDYSALFHISKWYWQLKPAFFLLVTGLLAAALPIKRSDWKAISLLISVCFVFIFFIY